MADRPILFSGPMVRALLAGTKTQTRRLPSFSRYRGFTEFGPSDTKGYDWHLRDSGMRWHDLRHAEVLKLLPWHTGDRLYVREAWHAARSLDGTPPRDIPRDASVEHAATARTYAEIGLKGKFRQGMHMPRWASRITLTVTDVRVERLQDISEQDAIAEGGKFFTPANELSHGGWSHDEWYVSETAKASYQGLWDRINGEGAWSANPWVAAYTFTVAVGNIDDLARAA